MVSVYIILSCLSIYLYTNKINGKQYIGQTRNAVKKRHAAHVRDALVKESHYYFHNALRSEGVENFKMEVIDTASTLQELNLKETYWILKLKTLRPEGYNLNTGGNSCQPCDETRTKLKVASIGKRNTKLFAEGTSRFYCLMKLMAECK